jgi:hypothetical protein
MTIDERLESIARNLDTLTKLHLDGEREWREAQAANEKSQAANEKRFAQITRNFEVVHDSIKRLERIAVAHEQRLDDLEDEEQ